MQKIAVAAGLALSVSLSTSAFAITTSVTEQQTISQSKITTTQPIVAYFSSIDNDTTAINQPDQEGFYRILLGRNADGHYLIQDYFQDTKKPQTEPYWVYTVEGLTSFGLEYVHGPLIGYYRNGKIAFKGTLDEGSYKTPFESYYLSGKVANKVSPMAKDFSRDEYFYEDGKKAIVYEFDEEYEPTSTKVWDNAGNPLSEDEAEAIEEDILEKIRFDN